MSSFRASTSSAIRFMQKCSQLLPPHAFAAEPEISASRDFACTRFGTRGSEVQILSPRPFKIKKITKNLHHEKSLMVSFLRAGRISAASNHVRRRRTQQKTRRPAGRLFHAQNREGNAFAGMRTAPVDCPNLPLDNPHTPPCRGFGCPGVAGYSFALPPLPLRSGSATFCLSSYRGEDSGHVIEKKQLGVHCNLRAT